MTQWKALWTIIKKDLLVFLRNPSRIVVTIVPSLAVLLLLVLQGAAVQGSPVAIVNQDKGAAAQQLVKDAQAYNGFLKATVMTNEQAQQAYNHLKVAAVLTIPAGFSRELAAAGHPTVQWKIQNFNADSANDLRRALPDIVNQFISQESDGNNPIHVKVAETDLHSLDAGFVPFEMVAVLVILLLQASTVNAGLAAVSEWESGSIKELLMSPASVLTVILGKILSGVFASDAVGIITVGVAAAGGLFPGLSVSAVLLSLLAATLLSFFGSGVGVTLASVFRVTEKTTLTSILIAFYLFFLSGGIVSLAYLPMWVRWVATFIPNTYAVNLFRNTLLYHSSAGLTTDLLILLAAAAVGLAMGLPAMRRSLAH